MSAELNTTTLGGQKIAKVGWGAMLLTWTPEPVPDEQAFEALKAGIDLLPSDTKLFINSGEFYGVNPRTANLELLSRFFDKYPELADRTILSVKGGTNADNLAPNSSEENLRRSVDTIIQSLGKNKKLDLFQCARVDPNVSIEKTIEILAKLKEEGKFTYIGVSEVAAKTLERANSVHPITAVEIEISPWAYEEETKKVISTAEKLGVTVIGYAPLGRGFLTGQLKREEMPANDMRLRFEKFKEDSWAQNQKLVDALSAIAAKKGVTTAQLSIAWVSHLGSGVVPLPGSGKAHRVRENLAAGQITFTEEELKEIKEAIEGIQIKGGRYFGGGADEGLWG
ncbi:hypothetical protein FRC02_012328 [Tulasnella sp. 418]|nr:hypothetical protein FRC02_012328 [Tulasnella sp. 418]